MPIPAIYRKTALDDDGRPIFDDKGNPVPAVGLPHTKQSEILNYVFSHVGTKETLQVDLCCGLGFGKTTLAIDLAQAMLSLGPEQRGLFLEPDVASVNDIFLAEWDKIVPSDLYKLNEGKRRITWVPTGALMYYGPRVVTGSVSYQADKWRGRNLTFVIDDETAIKFVMELYQNLMGRIRVKSPYRLYYTSSTPKVGPYGRFLRSKGHKLFKGATWDNPYIDKETIQGLKDSMSDQQARRELGGELIALEGRLWPEADIHTAWPEGNRHDKWTKFRSNEPWWLFCDLGGATGAYVVVQQTTSYYRNRELFPDSVWVAVADLCPHDDASASRAFQRLRAEFGTPVGVVAGADINTRSSGDGRTIAYFVEQVWPGASIYACSERHYDKQMQYDKLTFLIKSVVGNRRFTVAKNFVSLDKNSKRGVREMLEEDAMPEISRRRPSDVLPKNKEIVVQHVRDAMLMGAVKIMSPPEWAYTAEPAG